MDNASIILTTLDRHLKSPVRLILYGRAALQLGFNDAPPETAKSRDVDAIIPLADLPVLSENMDFWDAQEATNRELASDGLYITHLFQATQVFLRNDWEMHILPLQRPATKSLRLFRPATLDLILTKMMRGNDPQDMADIEFMIRHDKITRPQIESVFNSAIIPDVVELREAFERAKPIVRGLGLG